MYTMMLIVYSKLTIRLWIVSFDKKSTIIIYIFFVYFELQLFLYIFEFVFNNNNVQFVSNIEKDDQSFIIFD